MTWLINVFKRLFGKQEPVVKVVPPPPPVEKKEPQYEGKKPEERILDKNGMLLINRQGLELVKHFESCFLKAYVDPVGVYTIAWGRICYPDGSKVRKGDTCTQEQADAWLLYDLYEEGAKFIRSMTAEEDGLNDDQFSALVSFTYNRGCGRYDQKLDDLVDAGLSDKVLSPDESKRITDCMLSYNWAGNNQYLEGLDRRRYAEKALFEGRDWTVFKDVSTWKRFK